MADTGAVVYRWSLGAVSPGGHHGDGRENDSRKHGDLPRVHGVITYTRDVSI